jgi:AAA15 family ATPase/GTPase
MNEIPVKLVIAEVLQKIATTKGGLIRNLVKIFDEIMTFENIEILEKLIENYSQKNIQKDKIIQLKKLPSVIKNSTCFDGVI